MPELQPEKVDASLQEILAGPPFSEREWLAPLWKIIRQWLKDDVGDMYLEHPVLFWSAFIGLSLVLAFLVWHVAFSLRTAVFALRRALKPAPLQNRSSVAVTERLADARAAFARGAFLRTVELCWTAVIRYVGDGVDPCGSPRQQARELRQSLTRADDKTQVDVLVRLHEQACYAGRRPDRVLATQALEQAARLVER